MYQDKIEYLKRRIKRTYKRYTGERQDKKASLKDVADFFNIPIDESRVEDYTIAKIDFKTPSIEMHDNKTYTTYISKYTDYDDLLDDYGDSVRFDSLSYGRVLFNSLLAVNPNHKIKRLYYIEDTTPIIEKMAFKDGEYDLIFERDFANSKGHFKDPDTTFTISYIQQLDNNDGEYQQHLLTKIYRDSYSDEKHVGSFEQLYTYGCDLWIKRNDSQDKYTYTKNNSVVYGIREVNQRADHNVLRGICFESTNGSLKDYFPYNMNVANYPALKDKNIKSAMLFNGVTEESAHYLEIYKSDSKAHIKYNVKEKGFGDTTIVDHELAIPLLSAGNISNDDIQMILTTLQNQYDNDKFINLASCELTTFGKKIDIKNGVIEEENDMLNPKSLMNQSFDDIAEQIDTNKDEYFKLISEQFETATHINSNKEKGYVKTIKPKNSQNN